MTHYDVLGVAPDASDSTVRRAYLAAARRHHPDRHQGASGAERTAHERQMREVNEAWRVLSDPGERARYDQELRRSVRGWGRDAGDAGRAAGWRPYDSGDDDPPDPRLLADDPEVVAARAGPRWQAVAPGLLFLAGAGSMAIALVLGSGLVALVGLTALVASAVMFVLVPMFALFASARNDRR